MAEKKEEPLLGGEKEPTDEEILLWAEMEEGFDDESAGQRDDDNDLPTQAPAEGVAGKSEPTFNLGGMPPHLVGMACGSARECNSLWSQVIEYDVQLRQSPKPLATSGSKSNSNSDGNTIEANNILQDETTRDKRSEHEAASKVCAIFGEDKTAESLRVESKSTPNLTFLQLQASYRGFQIRKVMQMSDDEGHFAPSHLVSRQREDGEMEGTQKCKRGAKLSSRSTHARCRFRSTQGA